MNVTNDYNYFSGSNIEILDSDKKNNNNSESIANLISLVSNGDMECIRYYDVKEGFHKINNPGWIVFDLNEEKEISYIRILFWDNCGSEKKQPSRRKYSYRLLISKDHTEWEPIYDTMANGSNGWQEFFFECKIQNIRYIKLYLMCNSRDQFTHLVNIQAYRNPTKELYNYMRDFSEDKNIKKEIDFAPSINGLINNRIIINDKNSSIECAISLEIYGYVVTKLKEVYERIENEELGNIEKEIIERMDELNSIDNELQYFQNSMFATLLKKDKKEKLLRTLNKIVIVSMIVSIIMSVYDLWTKFI